MEAVKFHLEYENTDITPYVEPYVASVTYTDHAHGKADGLTIVLEDMDGLWRGRLYPNKGALVSAKIITPGHTLSLGKFAVDEIEPSGPPDIVTLKAVSAYITKPFRLEKKTKAWRDITLKKIVEEIAGKHGFSVFYDADEAVEYGRIDQREESDLKFIARLCDACGMNLKTAEEKIIVFEGKKYDARPPAMAISRGEDCIKRYRFSSKAHDVYRACQVSYADPETKENVSFLYTPPDPPPCGHVLKINKRVESFAAAEQAAKSELRRKNKGELTGSLTLVGRTDLLAGINIRIAGFGGVHDGNYFVEEAVHSLGDQGYLITVNIRKVLVY